MICLKTRESEIITVPLDLGEYFAGYSGRVVNVWVNASRPRQGEEVRLWLTLIRSLWSIDPNVPHHLSDAYDWLASIWSQAPDPTSHWTAKEVRTLNEMDPRLYQWLVYKTLDVLKANDKETRLEVTAEFEKLSTKFRRSSSDGSQGSHDPQEPERGQNN